MSDSKELAKKVEELLSVYEAQYPGDSRKKLPALREAAEAYLKLRLPAKAAPLYERTLSILKATEIHPSVERLATLDALATAYAACGRHREGLTAIEEAIATLKAHFPERTADLYSAMNNLGSTYLGFGAVRPRGEGLSRMPVTPRHGARRAQRLDRGDAPSTRCALFPEGRLPPRREVALAGPDVEEGAVR